MLKRIFTGRGCWMIYSGMVVGGLQWATGASRLPLGRHVFLWMTLGIALSLAWAFARLVCRLGAAMYEGLRWVNLRIGEKKNDGSTSDGVIDDVCESSTVGD